MFLEDGVKEYIKRRFQEENKEFSEEELQALVNEITCNVADLIDQELENVFDN